MNQLCVKATILRISLKIFVALHSALSYRLDLSEKKILHRRDRATTALHDFEWGTSHASLEKIFLAKSLAKRNSNCQKYARFPLSCEKVMFPSQLCEKQFTKSRYIHIETTDKTNTKTEGIATQKKYVLEASVSRCKEKSIRNLIE